MFLRMRSLAYLFFYACLFATSSSYSAANKVYSISAGELIQEAKSKGYYFSAKKMNGSSSCVISENTLIVKYLKNKNKASSARCLFTLFSQKKLARGWKVQAFMAVSNLKGEWRYLVKPTGKLSLFTIIEARIKSNNHLNQNVIRLNQIVLIGPPTSQSWRNALINP